MPQVDRWTRTNYRQAVPLGWNLINTSAWDDDGCYGGWIIDYYPLVNIFTDRHHAFAHVLTLAISGDPLAIKALRIVVARNAMYAEYKDTVAELENAYGKHCEAK